MSQSAFQRSIDAFNRGEFYACHDTLEAIWLEAEVTERNFYQGILQLAVACYHLENANWQGAVTLLGEGTYRLRAYQPTYAGVEVASLHAASCHLLQALHQIEPTAVGAFAARCQRGEWPLPKIDRTNPPEA